MGYYDPYPQKSLKQPLCLVGCSGAEVHSIAYWISGLTGLPYIEVDKLVEHEVGKGLAHLYLESGEEEWRAVERRLLSRTLGETPPRIICIGESALLNPESLRECLRRSELVYIRRPRDVLLKAIQRGRVETPNRFPYWSRHAPTDLEELDRFLRPREPAYEAAQHLVDAGELAPLELARRLITRLALLD